jgi:uncharacterized protein (TIGR03086 family)
MSTTIERFETAAAGFRARLAECDGAAYGRPTPCEGWDAAEPVDHAVGVLVFAGDTVGAPCGDVPSAPALDRFDRASGALVAKLADPALAATVVDSPVGRVALKQLVSSVVVHDLLVHTWDLARATGGDEVLDEGLVAHTLGAMTPFDDELRAHGFGPKVPPPPGADPQAALLCFLGRRP